MAIEERRATVTLTVSAPRLGLYLVPEVSELVSLPAITSTEASVSALAPDTADGTLVVHENGATVKRFEEVDGEPGEIEASRSVREGMVVSHINDSYVRNQPFTSIRDLLVKAPRPLRITFRDPEIPEYRDRFGFLRSKMHVDRESEYFSRNETRMRQNDMDWLTFLNELAEKRPTPFGVLRLLRDACGELLFPLEPAVRLNAMSPLHGKMMGISSDALHKRKATRSDELEGDVPIPVIDIYHRCWHATPNCIGIPNPPGLGVTLPGSLPSEKVAQKLHPRLQRLVLYGGISALYRGAVWYEMSGAHAKAALHPPGYYKALTGMKPKPEALYAIQKDVDRTFPGHNTLDTLEGIASLRRVLCAFAVHNPAIGYAQSLNFVAGFLLMLVEEEQAFWILEVLVNELLPPGYYDDTLLGVHTDQRVLAHLVWELMPDVAEVVQQAGIQLHIVTLEWFMCLFCTSLPTHTALRVWDAIFIRGSETLFRIALTLLYQNKTRFMSVVRSSTVSSIVVKSDGPGGVVVASEKSKKRDTVAETAQRVVAAASSVLGPPGTPAQRATSDGSVGSGSFSPVIRGGTSRHPTATFPAVYGMLKSLPVNAHDPDEMIRLAYPMTKKEESSTLSWDTHINASRLAKLRAAARTELLAESKAERKERNNISSDTTGGFTATTRAVSTSSSAVSTPPPTVDSDTGFRAAALTSEDSPPLPLHVRSPRV